MTKITTLFLLILVFITSNAQKTPTELARPIVEEGKRLYKSEMASWYGTDIFLEKRPNSADIGGYFSYTEKNISKCIFFSNEVNPKVIGTISFDSTYKTETATVELNERAFSDFENEMYLVRKAAVKVIGSDTIFKFYKNTNINLIPLITENERKVYVITAPTQNGEVIIGNDYLLTFDGDNNLVSRNKLHQNIIIISYKDEGKSGKGVVESMHSHLPETGDFITATDICTLMLYSKFAKWKQHSVLSPKYMNIWNCLTNSLTVVPVDENKK